MIPFLDGPLIVNAPAGRRGLRALRVAHDYISRKWVAQGNFLKPADFKAQSPFEQAMSIEQNGFDIFASGYCAAKAFNQCVLAT
ncbi:hypothetical protein DENSPDRAFT_783713 [Dentipellis sp. KUC8613]|nr:hypothetical protein DENSPDRAFT_783713 [Dentipellis sp. KUC8613]